MPAQIDFNGLVSQDALADLAQLLDAPSLDMPGKKVRETLLPGAIDAGDLQRQVAGAQLRLHRLRHLVLEKLFPDQGWQYPKTWDEMIALCKTIKAAGIAPWTYAGQHPRYMSWLVLSAAARSAGIEVLLAIDNLEPNAWKPRR